MLVSGWLSYSPSLSPGMSCPSTSMEGVWQRLNVTEVSLKGGWWRLCSTNMTLETLPSVLTCEDGLNSCSQASVLTAWVHRVSDIRALLGYLNRAELEAVSHRAMRRKDVPTRKSCGLRMRSCQRLCHMRLEEEQRHREIHRGCFRS